ncbi:hypothetical protein Dimus_004566 [Dionaea muscipula]
MPWPMASSSSRKAAAERTSDYKKEKKKKKIINPYADTGREKFSALLVELEERKQKILAQVGVGAELDVSFIRFIYSADHDYYNKQQQQQLKPVVFVHSKGTTGDKQRIIGRHVMGSGAATELAANLQAAAASVGLGGNKTGDENLDAAPAAETDEEEEGAAGEKNQADDHQEERRAHEAADKAAAVAAGVAVKGVEVIGAAGCKKVEKSRVVHDHDLQDASDCAIAIVIVMLVVVFLALYAKYRRSTAVHLLELQTIMQDHARGG